jgi:hypothetical protein
MTQSDGRVWKRKRELQATLDKLCKWADQWGITGSDDKCKVIHIGTNNPRTEYFINGTKLGTTEEEKDVGAYVNPSLKPSNHCKREADKAQQCLSKSQRTSTTETGACF